MDSFQQSMSDKPLQANKLIKVTISERSLPIVKMTKIRPWVMNGALFSKKKGGGNGYFPSQDYAERVSCEPDLDYPCQRLARGCRCAHFWVKGVLKWRQVSPALAGLRLFWRS